jgi:hypothetical protein
VTIAKRPSGEAGWRQQRHISEKPKAEYFFAGLWTTQISLNRLAKFDFTRHAFGGRLRRSTAAR